MAPPTARPQRGLRVARLVTAVYFTACALQGLARLHASGAGAQAFAVVMRLWYVEALVFGAFWGLAALAHGMLSGGGGDRAPRRLAETESHSVLRALERDRGR